MTANKHQTKDDARSQILRGAALCVARNGVRGLRMGDVARAAGVSSGLLYYHFTDRDGLLAATLAYVNDSAAAARGNTPDRSADARSELIDNLVDELSDAGDVRDNSIAWNEIGASAVFDPPLAAHLAESSRHWQQRVAAGLRAAQAQGSVAGGIDPDTFAVTATALIDGLSERWLTGRLTTAEARRLLRCALDTLLGH